MSVRPRVLYSFGPKNGFCSMKTNFKVYANQKFCCDRGLERINVHYICEKWTLSYQPRFIDEPINFY